MIAASPQVAGTEVACCIRIGFSAIDEQVAKVYGN